MIRRLDRDPKFRINLRLWFQGLAGNGMNRTAIDSPFPSPHPPQKNNHLRSQTGASVENYILPASSSGWKEALVPFVETGDENGSKNCDRCPTRRPLRVVHRRQRRAPGAEEQNAQDGVADDVAGFADEEVPNFEMIPVHAKQKMQQRIENPAGVVRRKQGAGLDGDKNEPEDRGDPGLQNVVAIGVQAHTLLDAIIGGLAGDHYIVDVALAESGAADAYEACFMQEFGDSGASAVAHARS